ncbi:MAG: hypothetical protein HC942_08065 [Microcoleus sp. SU_5_6]|nr:hypothetical protein [Microcoleus sp. SU_5_6]NJL66612.1 hypothetical protein [Microcoleus sp. SM1_3_4]
MEGRRKREEGRRKKESEEERRKKRNNNCQLSTVNCQLSTVNYQLSTDFLHWQTARSYVQNNYLSVAVDFHLQIATYFSILH